jgi:cap2 methyltransferase
MIYKFSQLDKKNTMTYKESLQKCKNTRDLKWGQLKLMLSELQFMTMYAQPGCLVIYIGAGPGYHIGFLAELYPDCQFDLWDSVKFNIDNPPSNIKYYTRYFTDNDAKAYAQSDKKILVITDLRNLDIRQHKKNNDYESMDTLVMDDMDMQAKWCQIMDPIAASLKFRLPYEKSYKYLDGIIYLQCFSQISTESRLVTNNYWNYVKYDVKQFDRMLAYHNAKNRCVKLDSSKWEKILTKHKLHVSWDSKLAVRICMMYLRSINQPASVEDGINFFHKIVAYIGKGYPAKLNIVYTK